PASSTELSFHLWCFRGRGRWRLRLYSDLGPSRLLCKRHPSPCSSENPALAGRHFRRGGGLGRATGEQCPEFSNLSVNPALLVLEPVNSGGDDFVRDFLCGWSLGIEEQFYFTAVHKDQVDGAVGIDREGCRFAGGGNTGG